MAAVVHAGLREAREALFAEVEPGTAAARALAQVTDRAIRSLADTAFARSARRWAVVALGGYGASRLLPYSDIDLLILTDADPRTLRREVEAILYPLWDAGLEIGHQVQTPRDHFRACREHIDTCTASLTGRYLTGDADLATAALGAVARDAARRRRTLSASFVGRTRPGSPYDLEPELKVGVGGQRDLDELVWLSALASGSPAHEVLDAAAPGWSGPSVLQALRAAQDTLTATRWLVHMASGRRAEQLSIDVADDVGIALGDLSHVHEGLAIVAETLASVRGAQPIPEPRATPWSGQDLLQALADGTAALPLLERAARTGSLEQVVPGLARLMTLRRPALGHRLTVGAHTLHAAALLAEVSGRDSLAARLLSEMEDARVLVAAALSHDAGKRTPGVGHAERGMLTARATARALGLNRAGAEDASLLVSEHLLLAETAAHQDIDDEDTVLRCAARIGRRDLVGPLYVLTVVDSLATGSDAWTEWHASLVGTLTGRLDAALSPATDGVGMVAAADTVRAEALAACRGRDDALARFIEAAPVRYLVSRTPDDVLRDGDLLAALGPDGTPGALALGVRPGGVDDSYIVTVAARRPRSLFSLMAGSLTLSGMDILEAAAFPGPFGTALGTFTVVSATLAPIEPERWARFERTLRAAEGGHLALGVRLQERRRHYPPDATAVPVRVRIDTDDPMTTVLRLTAPDRPGLLYEAADEIARAGFEIAWAKAAGKAGVARDVFHIRGSAGAVRRDPGELGHLAVRLRTRCAASGRRRHP